MNIVANQPVAKQAAPTFIFNVPPETIETNVLGMKVQIEAASPSEEAIQIAELTAGALEAFFATALQQDVIPHTETFKIRVKLSNQVIKPSFVIENLSSTGDLTWPQGLSPHIYSRKGTLRQLLFEVAAMTLSRNFILDDTKAFLETLFSDDGVQERMAMVMSVGNSYHRLADRYQSRLGDWATLMTTKYERRGRPHIEMLPLDKRPKPEPKEPRVVAP
jgi:hypothetical protein